MDDDHSNRHLIFKYFPIDKYDILQAINGQQGYEIALLEIPDIILMDWAMPIMNGIDTILKIKATSSIKNIPIIMATGVMTTSASLKEALEAGAIDFIRKPFDPIELASRIQAVLRIRESHKEISKQNEKIQLMLKRELENRERELSLQALQAHEKDKFLSDLKTQLEKIKSDPSENKLTKLIKDVDSQLHAGRTWENFMVHFERVHPQFFTKLQMEGNSLTNHDARLAAYILIGMNNKEIATFMGLEVGSVKSAVSRLKKKCSLGPKDSIREFIRTL